MRHLQVLFINPILCSRKCNNKPHTTNISQLLISSIKVLIAFTPHPEAM